MKTRMLRLVLVAAVVADTFTALAQDAKSYGIGEPFAPDVRLWSRLSLQSSNNLSFGVETEAPEAPAGGPSASELNQQLSNPVSSLWSISNQFNNFELNNGHWNNNCNFQPVLPIGLTKDWNLITRPVMPFYNIVPHPTVSGEWELRKKMRRLVNGIRRYWSSHPEVTPQELFQGATADWYRCSDDSTAAKLPEAAGIYPAQYKRRLDEEIWRHCRGQEMHINSQLMTSAL
jgi:hypothetical protein